MWYAIEALFRCNVQEENNNILYEKKIFLAKLTDELEDVSQKAEEKAVLLESKYKNSEGNDVYWQFVKIIEIQDLNEKEIYDGVEVFSKLVWENDLLE
jgi:hypothetical protein